MSQSLLIVGQSATPAELKLDIKQTMPSIPSDGKPHPAFSISIVDSTGKPKALPYSLNITISSSDERIIQVPKTATIKSTYYYVIINATSSVIESKQVEITVSASGFQSAKITATTGPPAGTPQALKVTILPNTLLPIEAGESDVIVTIVDSYGNPTKARSDISVSLFSSDLKIANVLNKNIVITTGSISAKTKVITTGFEGSSTITATSLNLKTDSATINVKGPKPAKIYLFAPANQAIEWTELFVGILDSNNKPVKLVTPMTITLYSSDTTILYFPTRTITIPAGEWSAMVEMRCINPGQAYVYASSTDLQSPTLSLRVYADSGNEPKSLKIYSFAPSYPVDGKLYQALIVQIVDAQGLPTKYWLNKIIDVTTTSKATFDTSTNTTVKIMSGDCSTTIWGIPLVPGEVTITVVAQDVLKAETKVTCYAPIPTSVTIQAPPIPAGGEVEACILTTASGIPVAVQQDTQFLLSSADTGVIESVESPIMEKKNYYVYTTLKGNAPGKKDMTVSGSGLPSAKISLTVLETKPSTFHLYYVKPIVNYNFPMIVQLTSSDGKTAAVTTDIIEINMASSNITNVEVPATITINPETTEAMVFSKGLGTKTSTVTLQSEDFKSLTTQITPVPPNLVLILTSLKSQYKEAEVATIKATVTLDGNPVEGMKVSWTGNGLTHTETTTGADGIAQNTLMIRAGSNKIDASINFGDGGVEKASKTITGIIGVYNLQVLGNPSYIKISGTGSYQYEERVYLEAPTQVGMEGIFGILGGKYVFRQWTGFIQSENNVETLTISGLSKNITVTAVYVEDYFMMIITIAVPLLLIIIGAYIYYTRYRRTIVIKSNV
ncbi:Ig-like domain-containing protein [Candidatus Bathyarchaeota archaeon]|nr:Ig-like domain-containing protein [Candidatus Bathyarchaeota archaeon]